ncbi:MAG: 50S ribosomal protein L25 [Dehalococcoidia bacterium]
MDRIELSATKRDILGKKVRFLRRQAITPANLYGHNVASIPLQIESSLLRSTIAKAGKSSLISLKVDGEKSPRTVIVRAVQRHPLDGELLHADLYQVKMAEKLKLDVPLLLVGEAPAVKDLDGIMLQDLSSLEVECLPADMPHNIEVDLSSLTGIDQAVHVKDLSVGEGVTILTDLEKVVVLITARRVEVIEEAVPEAEEEAEEEAVAEATEKSPEK